MKAVVTPVGRRVRATGALYVLPALAVLVVTSLLPTLLGAYYSLTDYSGLGDKHFVGFDNYVQMFHDPAVGKAAWVTVVFTIITVPVQTVLSMLLAEILAKTMRNWFGSVARSVLFIPVIASMVLVGTVWRILLSNEGFVNGLLRAFGIASVNWLGSPMWALPTVAMIAIWKDIGYFLVIYYAAILDVPKDLYESAALDGAGPFKRFWHITMPQTRHATVLIVIVGTMWSFQTFDIMRFSHQGGLVDV
ncbi:MAG: sugar ABC transporter permease [Bifidobacteriaceae bacterium]|jgi:multiple sugar transport system permease protein|nr:sugar ABC transporter permease [Bifidobacteriaceae bacterium]